MYFQHFPPFFQHWLYRLLIYLSCLSWQRFFIIFNISSEYILSYNWKDLQNKPTVYLLLSFPLSLLKMNGFVFSTFSIGETRETFVISINGKHKSNTCQSQYCTTFVFSIFWIGDRRNFCVFNILNCCYLRNFCVFHIFSNEVWEELLCFP